MNFAKSVVVHVFEDLNISQKKTKYSDFPYHVLQNDIQHVLILWWSETKHLKISTPDDISLLYPQIVKLCTLKQLENIHQKWKLKFHDGVVSLATIQQR